MSEVDWYKGKLVKVEKIENETLEEQCKRLVDDELETWYEDYTDMLLDKYYEEYVLHVGELYRVENIIKKDEWDSIFNSKMNSDGSIDFEVKYYNGGCGFTEAIEYALKELK